ncbi:MAG: hypothetical protein GY856_46120 [bacterium]|nr:hypothetical protein [bacterium]
MGWWYAPPSASFALATLRQGLSGRASSSAFRGRGRPVAPLGLYLVVDKLFLAGEAVTASRSVLVALLLISGVQFVLFAMFFDMEASKED